MGKVVSFHLGEDCQQVLGQVRGELSYGVSAKKLLEYVCRCPTDDLRRILGTIQPKQNESILQEYATNG